jgi:hypothetical protein
LSIDAKGGVKYASDIDEIRSDEMQVLSEFVSIDDKGGVK